MTLARCITVPALAGVLQLAATAAWADLDANIVDLGTLGGESSAATAINESGQVAGVAQIPDELGGDQRPFLYDHGTMLNLGTFGGSYCEVRDLNNSGHVVGYAENSSGRERAFLYSGGAMTDLGTFGGASSEAWDINDSGQVVGYADVAVGQYHAFLYSAGVMTDLGTLGGSDSYAIGINEAGQITGYANTLTEIHAFRYSGGVMDDLGTLGGSQSYGWAINAGGDVVGSSLIAGNAGHRAFFYDASEDVMTDLGSLGGSYSSASRINASGQIAGESLIAGDTERHAFFYSNGVMVDISTPGWTSPYISHLSDTGEVLFSEYNTVTYERRAWYYKDGVRKSVGTLDGYSSYGFDMNSSGIIVGETWPPTPADGRHAFMTSCPLLPSADCNSGQKASVLIKDEDDDERDQLTWKWSGGDQVVQADLGNPGAGTSYALCLYDSTTNADSLVSVLRSGIGDDWHDKDPKGWSYGDGDSAHDGIRRVQVKPGAAGSPKARLVARGASIPMPGAASVDEMFDSDPDVTVQLRNDSTDMCWTSTFTAPKTNDPARYSARTP